MSSSIPAGSQLNPQEVLRLVAKSTSIAEGAKVGKKAIKGATQGRVYKLEGFDLVSKDDLIKIMIGAFKNAEKPELRTHLYTSILGRPKKFEEIKALAQKVLVQFEREAVSRPALPPTAALTSTAAPPTRPVDKKMTELLDHANKSGKTQNLMKYLVNKKKFAIVPCISDDSQIRMKLAAAHTRAVLQPSSIVKTAICSEIAICSPTHLYFLDGDELIKIPRGDSRYQPVPQGPVSGPQKKTRDSEFEYEFTRLASEAKQGKLDNLCNFAEEIKRSHPDLFPFVVKKLVEITLASIKTRSSQTNIEGYQIEQRFLKLVEDTPQKDDFKPVLDFVTPKILAQREKMLGDHGNHFYGSMTRLEAEQLVLKARGEGIRNPAVLRFSSRENSYCITTISAADQQGTHYLVKTPEDVQAYLTSGFTFLQPPKS